MRIEVYHRGELLLTVPIETPRRYAMSEIAYKHREAAVNGKIRQVREQCIRIMGEAGKQCDICLVAPSMMNHWMWERLPKFSDVEDWIKNYDRKTA